MNYDATLLGLVLWTLVPGPKTFWERFIEQEGSTWKSFQSSMEIFIVRKSYIPGLYMRFKSIILQTEMSLPHERSNSTRNYHAFTRTVNEILHLANDLPKHEQTDLNLLQYLRNSMQGVELTKMVQLS